MQKNVSRALSRRNLSHTQRLKPTTLLVTRAACGIASGTRTFASSSSPKALSANEYVSFGQAHVAKGVSRLVEDVIQSGQGSWVTMTSGKRLLDFTCGIGVTGLGELEVLLILLYALFMETYIGHCHPVVSKAAAEQTTKVVHAMVRTLAS